MDGQEADSVTHNTLDEEAQGLAIGVQAATAGGDDDAKPAMSVASPSSLASLSSVSSLTQYDDVGDELLHAVLDGDKARCKAALATLQPEDACQVLLERGFDVTVGVYELTQASLMHVALVSGSVLCDPSCTGPDTVLQQAAQGRRLRAAALLEFFKRNGSNSSNKGEQKDHQAEDLDGARSWKVLPSILPSPETLRKLSGRASAVVNQVVASTWQQTSEAYAYLASKVTSKAQPPQPATDTHVGEEDASNAGGGDTASDAGDSGDSDAEDISSSISSSMDMNDGNGPDEVMTAASPQPRSPDPTLPRLPSHEPTPASPVLPACQCTTTPQFALWFVRQALSACGSEAAAVAEAAPATAAATIQAVACNRALSSASLALTAALVRNSPAMALVVGLVSDAVNTIPRRKAIFRAPRLGELQATALGNVGTLLDLLALPSCATKRYGCEFHDANEQGDGLQVACPGHRLECPEFMHRECPLYCLFRAERDPLVHGRRHGHWSLVGDVREALEQGRATFRARALAEAVDSGRERRTEAVHLALRSSLPTRAVEQLLDPTLAPEEQEQDLSASWELTQSDAVGINHIDSEYGTFLHSAARGNAQEDTFHLLLRQGADVTVVCGPLQETVLHTVAEYATAPSLVPLLVHAGADVNAERSDGKTPLHLASQAGNTVMVAALLALNASVFAMDVAGNTPASFASSPEIVHLLRAKARPISRLRNPHRN
eukprot:m.233282 g.233282  ORF g.233282 m.233282 type:complete len:721 (-) comp18898_c1_seq3:63-2225(-)